VVDYIEEHLEGGPTLAQLAAVVRLNPYHFARQFKAATGLPPHQFARAGQWADAADELDDDDTSGPDMIVEERGGEPEECRAGNFRLYHALNWLTASATPSHAQRTDIRGGRSIRPKVLRRVGPDAGCANHPGYFGRSARRALLMTQPVSNSPCQADFVGFPA
jgi:AraC-like DNA-binding protein